MKICSLGRPDRPCTCGGSRTTSFHRTQHCGAAAHLDRCRAFHGNRACPPTGSVLRQSICEMGGTPWLRRSVTSVASGPLRDALRSCKTVSVEPSLSVMSTTVAWSDSSARRHPSSRSSVGQVLRTSLARTRSRHSPDRNGPTGGGRRSGLPSISPPTSASRPMTCCRRRRNVPSRSASARSTPNTCSTRLWTATWSKPSSSRLRSHPTR